MIYIGRYERMYALARSIKQAWSEASQLPSSFTGVWSGRQVADIDLLQVNGCLTADVAQEESEACREFSAYPGSAVSRFLAHVQDARLSMNFTLLRGGTFPGMLALPRRAGARLVASSKQRNQAALPVAPAQCAPRSAASTAASVRAKTPTGTPVADALKGIHNARDLAEALPGIAHGRVLRCALPSAATPSDIEFLLNHRAIDLLVDLRSDEELKEDVNSALLRCTRLVRYSWPRGAAPDLDGTDDGSAGYNGRTVTRLQVRPTACADWASPALGGRTFFSTADAAAERAEVGMYPFIFVVRRWVC